MADTPRPKGKGNQDNHDQAKWKLKFEYTEASNSAFHKGLDAVFATCALANNPATNLGGFLQGTTDLIARTFKLRFVTIGLRGNDGLYRYLYHQGAANEAWTFLKAKSYVESDFFTSQNWNGDLIGKLTKIYFVEDDPWIEKDSFNRPAIVGIKRRSPEEWVEGDYIDTHIRGANGALLGWIEILGVMDGKIPDVHTLKFLEIISGITGRRVESKRP
jgi:hypothetical protein